LAPRGGRNGRRKAGLRGRGKRDWTDRARPRDRKKIEEEGRYLPCCGKPKLTAGVKTYSPVNDSEGRGGTKQLLMDIPTAAGRGKRSANILRGGGNGEGSGREK